MPIVNNKSAKHSPDELLDTAEALLKLGNSRLTRVALLEALTALETFVYSNVFAQLREKFDDQFALRLENKTKFDSDSRLSTLVTLATDIPVDKGDKLWADYKAVRRLRNQATHDGKRIDKPDARLAINTAYAWMTFIDQAIEQSRETADQEYIDSFAVFFARFFMEWSKIETLLYEAAVGYIESDEIQYFAAGTVIGILQVNSVITPALAAELTHLRHIRNSLAHFRSVPDLQEQPEVLERLVDAHDQLKAAL